MKNFPLNFLMACLALAILGSVTATTELTAPKTFPQRNLDDEEPASEGEGSEVLEDIAPIIKELVPKAFNCDGEASPIKCTHQTIATMAFEIKYTTKSLTGAGGAGSKAMHVVTLTNRPENPDGVGPYHASYKVMVETANNNTPLKTRLGAVFAPTSQTGRYSFITELMDSYPMKIQEVAGSTEVLEIVRAMFGPTIQPEKSGTAIRYEGGCLDKKGMICSLILYPVSLEYFRIQLKIGRRSLNYALTAVRFRTNFREFKPKIIKFIETSMNEEARKQQFPAAFNEAREKTVAAIETVCAGCGKNREIGNARPEDLILFKPFSLKRKATDKKGGEIVTNYSVLTLYYSFEAVQYLHVLLDSDRLQTEAMLDLNLKSLEENMESEINIFVSRNNIQPTSNKAAVELTIDDVHDRLRGVEKKCKEGVISDVTQPLSFNIKCGKLEVVRVTDVESDSDSAIRIDFLVNPDATNEVTEAGFILQKTNTFDQMEMVRKVVEKYLSGSAFNPGLFNF